MPCRMRGQKCRRETDTAKATQTGKHKSCLLPLNKTPSQHHCPGQADLLGQSPERSCSRAMMLPTISYPSQISGEPGSCPATHRTVIFCCYPFNSQSKETLATLSLRETLRETNNIFLLFVFVSTEENHRVFSCQSIPISITGSLGLGFEGFGGGLAYTRAFQRRV